MGELHGNRFGGRDAAAWRQRANIAGKGSEHRQDEFLSRQRARVEHCDPSELSHRRPCGCAHDRTDIVSVSSLILTAEHPVTRTSADCENAALALLATSTWSEGAWKGTYTCWNPHQTADMWPGDLLQVEAPSADMSTELLVRNVEIRATSCAPELLSYTVAFANEWAEALSLKMNEGAPLNAWLPPIALTAPRLWCLPATCRSPALARRRFRCRRA